ncbi:MAG TPA: hypothetical protein VLZ83_16870 [Edaphocola sp.]|nr:hypothetical protein [Edaphocola sp.]
MKKIIILLSFSAIVINSFAQRNTIDMAFNPKIWLNQYDVYHDKFMNDAIQNRNAMPAASFNFDYSHKTPYGLIYGAGIQLGFYQEQFYVIYDNLRGFREDGRLDNRISVTEFNNRYGYASIGANIGYSLKLSKPNNSLDFQFGIMKMLPFNGEYITDEIIVTEFITREPLGIADYYWFKGSGGTLFKGPTLFEGVITYRFTPKKLNRSFFVGLSGSYNASFRNGDGLFDNPHSGFFALWEFQTQINGERKYGDPNNIYGEIIANKFISLGVKLGMNLFNF